MNERGYVIIAARQTRYLELAIDAALALRAYNPEPIALICDAAVSSALPGRGSPFDDVIALPDEFNARNIWTLALGRISNEVLLELAASDERVDLITNPLAFPWYPNQWIEDRERFLEIHFLGELPAALWARFKHEIPARRRAAGLPEHASLPLWDNKARFGFW